MQHLAPRITLKDSVYAVEHPEGPGLYFELCRRVVTLRGRALATLFQTYEQACEVTAKRLAGVPHEIVRLDA